MNQMQIGVTGGRVSRLLAESLKESGKLEYLWHWQTFNMVTGDCIWKVIRECEKMRLKSSQLDSVGPSEAP